MDSQDPSGITVGATEVLAFGATLTEVMAGVILIGVTVTHTTAGATEDGVTHIMAGDLDSVLFTVITA